jgi:hypothetical protein
MNAHGTAHGPNDGVWVSGAALGCDMLDIGVSEPGGYDRTGAHSGSRNSPDAVLLNTKVAQHDRRKEKHSDRVCQIVQNAIDSIRKRSLPSALRLCGTRGVAGFHGWRTERIARGTGRYAVDVGRRR